MHSRGDDSSQASSVAGHRKRMVKIEYHVRSLYVQMKRSEEGIAFGEQIEVTPYLATRLKLQAKSPRPVNVFFRLGLTACPLRGDLIAPLTPLTALPWPFRAPFVSSILVGGSAPG